MLLSISPINLAIIVGVRGPAAIAPSPVFLIATGR
jgi:hypothetical protein